MAQAGGEKEKPRYEARDWAGILGRKRHWIVYDRKRGGVAVNNVIHGRQTFSQYGSKESAERAAANLNTLSSASAGLEGAKRREGMELNSASDSVGAAPTKGPR